MDAGARKQNYAEINTFVAEAFATKTRDEWLDILQSYEFAYAPIYDYTEVVEEPQVTKNQYIVDYDHPVLGKTRITGFPVKFSQTPAQIYRCVPDFGQDTEEVLLDVGGYGWEDISRLKEAGVIP